MMGSDAHPNGAVLVWEPAYGKGARYLVRIMDVVPTSYPYRVTILETDLGAKSSDDHLRLGGLFRALHKELTYDVSSIPKIEAYLAT